MVAALLVESLFVCALVFTHLNSLLAGASAPNSSHFGIAIGCVFMAGQAACSSISGGALNPVRVVDFLCSFASVHRYNRERSNSINAFRIKSLES